MSGLAGPRFRQIAIAAPAPSAATAAPPPAFAIAAFVAFAARSAGLFIATGIVSFSGIIGESIGIARRDVLVFRFLVAVLVSACKACAWGFLAALSAPSSPAPAAAPAAPSVAVSPSRPC